MTLEGSLGASRFVHCALAVAVVPEVDTVSPHLVAMPSAATSQTGPLVSAHFFPRPVIALDAISKTLKSKSKFQQNNFFFSLGLDPIRNVNGGEYLS